MPNGNGDSLILTPQDENRVFVFTVNNKPQYVVEVPGCRFNGLPIMLATDNKFEAPKVLYMRNEFIKLWNDIALKGIGGVKS